MWSMIERYGPLACGVAAAGIAWANLPAWSLTLAERNEGGIENALGPIFDLATFSAGTLFAIYVLALSKSNGFLGKLFGTKTFIVFHNYVGTDIFLCVLLCLWTTFYMVLGVGEIIHTPSRIFMASWLGLSVWSLLSVTRVVLIFMVIVGAKSAGPSGNGIAQHP